MGYFKGFIPAGEYSVKVAKKGFIDYDGKLTVRSKDEKANLEIILNPREYLHDEPIVSERD
jgi:hypothetical protein